MDSYKDKVVMVVSPHADDAAAFCGGTLAKFADQGAEILLVRVTDDSKDSVGLSIEETISRNREELIRAADILGIKEIIELGFETDTLADLPLGRLRERFVFLLRKHRPYAVFSFDPYGLYENNQDHVRAAQALDEAYWVSCFDKHYPQHFQEGLEPFSVYERWYFARQLQTVTHYEEVTEYMEKKTTALCAHREMMRNTLNQYRLQARTWGKTIPMLEEAVNGDPRQAITTFLYGQAQVQAAAAGWEEGTMAEAFRLERFGDLDPLFESTAISLDTLEKDTPEKAG
jgi:LmbE family N-acetylglucosaminyl deacetylase